MKIKEDIGMKGRLTLLLRNKKGEVAQGFTTRNTIVLTGRRLVAEMFANGSGANVSQIALGTGTTDTLPGDQTNSLETPLPGAEKPIGKIDVSDHDNDRVKVTLSTDFDSTEAIGALSEAGLFNSDGVMYNRVRFPTINKTDEFQLTLVWEVIF